MIGIMVPNGKILTSMAHPFRTSYINCENETLAATLFFLHMETLLLTCNFYLLDKFKLKIINVFK